MAAFTINIAESNFRHTQGAGGGNPPGDVLLFPPGEKHWHGATATTAMSHIAVQEALKRDVVEWMEKVGDAQYRR